jgi:two-component system, NtrC family, nitrogen regulation sensor histidine kinase NtrY
MSLFKPTLRKRIYLSMLAMIVLSLFIIGTTTIIYFDIQNEAYHIERLKRKEHSVIASLSYFFKDAKNREDLNAVSRDFEEEISKLADINSIQINIYTLDGEILMSSNYDFDNPDYYKNSIPDEYLTDLKNTGERQVEELDDENISTYSYLLSPENNSPIAIVNLPYNRAQNPDSNLLKPFLTTLIEVYLFLFLGAGLLAYLLSNYITKSIRTISDKLRGVDIDKKNEPIIWRQHDEIGVLVEEYNKMIDQLEESAKKLAQSQKEAAWREMAKQVAHEIKNPLTPMKLSVQHLERSLEPNDPDFKEKMTLFRERMIQQIDTLSSIATEFSNFAKMPKSVFETIDLNEVVSAAVFVFQNEDNIQLNFTSFEKSAIVQGDREQLTRVFNNLLKNAIQSIPADRKGEIVVKVQEKRSVYEVQIADNGCGIDGELKEKIFMPNFTTKSSGSGLGLAMVQQIILSHEGSIYFETTLNEGTIFHVELPKSNENA